MVNGLFFYSALLVLLTTKSAFTLWATFIHWVIHSCNTFSLLYSFTGSAFSLSHTLKHQRTHRRQHGVQRLALGHLSMWSVDVGNQSTNFPTGGQLLLLQSYSCHQHMTERVDVPGLSPAQPQPEFTPGYDLNVLLCCLKFKAANTQNIFKLPQLSVVTFSSKAQSHRVRQRWETHVI